MEPKRLVTTKQLASRLVVSERHIYRLMSAGKLPPPVRIGRCLRWKPKTSRGWRTKGQTTTAKPKGGDHGLIIQAEDHWLTGRLKAASARKKHRGRSQSGRGRGSGTANSRTPRARSAGCLSAPTRLRPGRSSTNWSGRWSGERPAWSIRSTSTIGRPWEIISNNTGCTLRPRTTQNATSRETIGQIKKVLDDCDFRHIADIDSEKVSHHLKSRRRLGMSTERSNHYVRAIKGFTKWMEPKRVARDPLKELKTQDAARDRRLVRRALPVGDFVRLIEAARDSRASLCGLTGSERAMLYLVAAYTGLRASELASLTPDSFNLTEMSISLGADSTKNGKNAELPLHHGLIEQLKSWMDGRPEGRPLWPGKWAVNRHAASMLRADLEAAGIPYVDRTRRDLRLPRLEGPVRHRDGPGRGEPGQGPATGTAQLAQPDGQPLHPPPDRRPQARGGQASLAADGRPRARRVCTRACTNH